MRKVFEKYILFEYCYYFVFFNFILKFVRPKILKFISSDSVIFFIPKILSIFFTLYILLGLIKFAIFFNLNRFKKLIKIIVIFSLIFFPAGFFSIPEKSFLSHLFYGYSLIFMLLYHFAYKTAIIKETDLIQKLSKYYLYGFIAELVVYVSIRIFQFCKFISPIFMISLIATNVILITILITKMKLFKFLEIKFEKSKPLK